MDYSKLIPLAESAVPYLKSIVEGNIANPVEKAALLGLIDLCKAVADAYVAEKALAQAPQ